MKDLKWVEAVEEEMRTLNENGAIELVDTTKRKTLVGSKKVSNIKYKSSGVIERHRALLDAKGYTRTNGIDYKETFIPLMKMKSLKAILFLHSSSLRNSTS